jgi:dTDP-4-amino-4,6-dideoxygalactose transaminase
VVKAKGTARLDSLIGFNYRMTEIEAAIAAQQLKKLERLVVPRIEAAGFLTERLSQLPGLTPPLVRDQVRHGYYVYALRYDAEAAGCPRGQFAEAVWAEGIPIHVGYVEPLYRQPMYQRGIGYGREGFPFRQPDGSRIEYPDGLCPVAERMHEAELLYLTTIHAAMTRADLDDIVAAFDKVATWAGKGATV